MIDVENYIYTVVRQDLLTNYSASFPSLQITNEYVDIPVSMPLITIAEIDNRIFERMRTEEIENAAMLTYEVNIYTNNPGIKRFLARELAKGVDHCFSQLGFTRTFMETVPNIRDASICRIVCRYEGIIGSAINADSTIDDMDSWLIYHNV